MFVTLKGSTRKANLLDTEGAALLYSQYSKQIRSI